MGEIVEAEENFDAAGGKLNEASQAQLLQFCKKTILMILRTA